MISLRFPTRARLFLLGVLAGPAWAFAQPAALPVLFDHSFEDASLGRIEVLGGDTFRLHVAGQEDERGRNRQANWYYFRMDRVAGRELTLIVTDFVGEYDDLPGAVPMTGTDRPVYSEDGETWHFFTDFKWDSVRKEATLNYRPHGDSLWVAHVPPYPYSRLVHLLAELDRSPDARVELIGRTVLGRDIPFVTVTNSALPDADKKVVCFIARQHAWETGTSYAMEGALRFIVSDDPRARALRDRTVFLFLPMADPDGCATGKVRFNAHGYDFNRHWEEVDLRNKEWLRKTPEIWYEKKAILAQEARQHIDLVIDLHNNDTNEYAEGMVTDPAEIAVLHRFYLKLVAHTSFDPTRPDVTIVPSPPHPTTEALWRIARIPALVVEQRIDPSPKLHRLATSQDRMDFGRDLIAVMADSVR